MRRILLLATILVFMLQTFCQDSTFSKQYYLQKSKSQKTTGWILVAGGTTMFVAGGIILAEGIGNEVTDAFGGTGESHSGDVILGSVLMLGGIAADVGGFVLFHNSKKNARMAAAISFDNQNILLPHQNGLSLRYQPSISLKIML